MATSVPLPAHDSDNDSDDDENNDRDEDADGDDDDDYMPRPLPWLSYIHKTYSSPSPLWQRARLFPYRLRAFSASVLIVF